MTNCSVCRKFGHSSSTCYNNKKLIQIERGADGKLKKRCHFSKTGLRITQRSSSSKTTFKSNFNRSTSPDIEIVREIQIAESKHSQPSLAHSSQPSQPDLKENCAKCKELNFFLETLKSDKFHEKVVADKTIRYLTNEVAEMKKNLLIINNKRQLGEHYLT